MLRAEGKKKGVHLHHEGAPVFFPDKILKAKLIILIGLLLLTACSREKEDAAFLQHVDSLADVLPEQADTLLSSSQDSSHYARLLRVKVDDKLYRPVTGYEPLVIDTLLPYFHRHGDSHRLSTALFYAGRICADKGDAPQAIDYYQQTLDALPEGEDPCFRGLIHIQIGWLFLYEELFPNAISQFKYALQYERKVKDSIYIAHCLQSTGNCFFKEGKTDSAFVYYHEALRISYQTNNRRSKSEVLNELAHVSVLTKDFERAHHYLSLLFENGDSTIINNTYTIALMLSYEEDVRDSILFYGEKVLEAGDVYNKYTAYKALASYYLKIKEPEIALQYQNKWEECDDSIRKLESRNTIARMHSLYNYQLREKQVVAEKEKKEEARQIAIFLSMLTLLLLLTVFALWQYAQKRKQQYKFRLDILERIKEHSLEELEKKESKIHHLETQIKDTLCQIDILKNQKSDQLEKDEEIRLLYQENERMKNDMKELTIDIEFLRSLRKKNADAIHAIKSTSIYKRLLVLESENATMRKEDWKELFGIIEQRASTFKNNLFSLITPSESEYKISVLLKLDISQAKIARLISMTPSGVTHACHRLYRKIKGEKGTVEDLVSLLKDL